MFGVREIRLLKEYHFPCLINAMNIICVIEYLYF